MHLLSLISIFLNKREIVLKISYLFIFYFILTVLTSNVLHAQIPLERWKTFREDAYIAALEGNYQKLNNEIPKEAQELLNTYPSLADSTRGILLIYVGEGKRSMGYAQMKVYMDSAEFLLRPWRDSNPMYAYSLTGQALAVANINTKDRLKAITLLKEALDLFLVNTGPAHIYTLNTRINLMYYNYLENNNTERNRQFEELNKIAKDINNENSLKAYLQAIFQYIHFSDIKYEQIKDYFSLDVAKKLQINNPTTYAAIMEIGCFMLRKGWDEKGMEYVNYAREEAFKKYPDDLSLEVRFNTYWVSSMLSIGEDEKIHTHLLELVEKLEKANRKDLLLTVYKDAGIQYSTYDYFSEALEYLNKARKVLIADFPDNITAQVSINSQIANIYRELGQFQNALHSLQNILPYVRKEEGVSLQEKYTLLNELAIIYEKNKQYDSAAVTYDEIHQFIRKVGYTDSFEEAQFLMNNATFLRNIRRYDESILKAEEAMKIVRKYPSYQNNPNISFIDINYALAFLFSKKLDSAYTHSSFATQRHILRHGPYHGISKSITLIHAQICLYSGRIEEAIKITDSVVYRDLKSFEKKFTRLTDKERGIYLSNSTRSFDVFLESMLAGIGIWSPSTIPYKNHNPNLSAKIFDYFILMKGILFTTDQRVRTSIIESKNIEVKQIYDDWRTLREQLVKIPQNEEKFKQLESKADSLELLLSSKSAEFKNYYNTTPIEWENVKKALRKKEAVVEIFKASLSQKSYYFASILKAHSKYPEIIMLSDSAEWLDGPMMKYYINSIKMQLSDTLSYNVYWSKIQNHLKGISTVFFVTDGVYHQINPATLKDPKTKTYLLDKILFVHLSNSKELLIYKRNTKNKDGVKYESAEIYGYPQFRIGDPIIKSNDSDNNRAYSFGAISDLPGTLEEVVEIQQILEQEGTEVKLFTGIYASEDTIKKINTPSLLHIATHGFF